MNAQINLIKRIVNIFAKKKSKKFDIMIHRADVKFLNFLFLFEAKF